MAIRFLDMLEIEDKMLDAGFDQQRVKEAQVLYVLALSDYAEEAGFVDKLVGCFADGQSDAQLISAVNAAFGTNLSAEDFTKVMSAIRAVYLTYYPTSVTLVTAGIRRPTETPPFPSSNQRTAVRRICSMLRTPTSRS